MNFAFILVNFYFILITVEGQVSLLSKYKDICEKINIDLLLKNQHFVSQQIDCLLDGNSCTRDGLLIRGWYYGWLLMSFFSSTGKVNSFIYLFTFNQWFSQRKY